MKNKEEECEESLFSMDQSCGESGKEKTSRCEIFNSTAVPLRVIALFIFEVLETSFITRSSQCPVSVHLRI